MSNERAHLVAGPRGPGDDAGAVEDTVEVPDSLFTRTRILIGYAQIASSLNLTYEIPWPPAFRNFVLALNVVNLNFLDVLSPAEAVALIRRCARAAGSLTYGWLSPGNPDPAGARIRVVRVALKAHSYIEALFWDVRATPPPPFPLSRTHFA